MNTELFYLLALSVMLLFLHAKKDLATLNTKESLGQE